MLKSQQEAQKRLLASTQPTASRVISSSSTRSSSMATDIRLNIQGQPLTISLEGEPDRFGTRTAVLRGSVATAEDRLVAGKLAMMSPGVGTVRNEVRVVGSKKATSAGG